ncbi:hypothetical protein LXL04_005600 [Taraxacum kok-saghyz]
MVTMTEVDLGIQFYNQTTSFRKHSVIIKECIAECDEVFGAALDDIQNTLDRLESLNLGKANFDVSAVATNMDTCNDCFNEMVGGDPEVKKFGDWVQSITDEALEAPPTFFGQKFIPLTSIGLILNIVQGRIALSCPVLSYLFHEVS